MSETRSIRGIRVPLTADLSGWGKGLKQASTMVDRFYGDVGKALGNSPFGRATKAVGDFGKGFTALARSAVAPLKPIAEGLKYVGQEARQGVADVAKLAGGLAALAVAGLAATAALASSGLQRIGELGDVSLGLGIASDKLSELQYAAVASGAKVEDLNGFLRGLRDTIHESIGNAYAPASRAFQRLGTSAEELSRLTPDKQFDRLKKGFDALPDAAAKADAAVKIGGEAGLKLFRLLGMGAAEFEALKRKSAATGFTVRPEDLAKVQAANAAWATIGATFEGVVNQLTVALAPAVALVADKFTSWFADVSKDSRFFPGLLDALVAGVGGLADTAVSLSITFKEVFAGIGKAIGDAVGNVGLFTMALAQLRGDPALQAIGFGAQQSAAAVRASGEVQVDAAKRARAEFEKSRPSQSIAKLYEDFKAAAEKKSAATAADTKQTQIAASANAALATSTGDLLKEFHNSIKDAGLTAEMKRVAELRRSGANPFDVAEARRLAPHVREAGKRDSLAEDLRESTKLPVEKLGEDLKRISQLAAEGKITRRQALLGAAQKTKESGIAGGQMQFAGALQANSAEGRSYLLSQTMGRPQDAIDVARQGVAATMQGNGYLSRLLGVLGRPDTQVSF